MKSDISVELRSLYRAIGELSYVLASEDARITSLEKLVFFEAAKEELGKDAWVAQDSFNALINQPLTAKLSVEQAYNHVLYIIKQNRYALTNDLVEVDRCGKVFERLPNEAARVRFRRFRAKVWRSRQ